MSRFELGVLPQEEDYQTPYELVEGFNDRWWHDRAGPVGEGGLDGKEYLQFLAEGNEVGRAEITDWLLSDGYEGIDTPISTKEIWFFEIRQELRRHGYGAEFAQHLVEYYPGIPLIAFSEDADEFWSGIGWHYFPRKDGIGWPQYRSLFISEQISQ